MTWMSERQTSTVEIPIRAPSGRRIEKIRVHRERKNRME